MHPLLSGFYKLEFATFRAENTLVHFATHGGSAAYGIEALKTKRARYDQKGTLSLDCTKQQQPCKSRS